MCQGTVDAPKQSHRASVGCVRTLVIVDVGVVAGV